MTSLEIVSFEAAAETTMPLPVLLTGAVPSMFVPIRLPWTVFRIVPESSKAMPSPLFPEMTFRAPAPGPAHRVVGRPPPMKIP